MTSNPSAANVLIANAVPLFESMGIAIGIAIEKLCDVVVFLESKRDRQLPGHMKRGWDHRRSCE